METRVIETEQLLQTFLEMVRINSPSGEEGPMREYLIGWCQRQGLAYQVDEGGNLIVEVPGPEVSSAQEILVLSGHMDVVPPCLNIQPIVEGVGDERIIYSDNTTVLGADDKAGLAVILEVVETFLKEGLPRPSLRLIFTTREETYLQGAKEVQDKALEASFSVIFDHTGPQGTIIHQAPSYYEFQIECFGKSVHAGIMPEKGVNAIVFAGRVIDRLRQENYLGRIDEWTTANIGFIEGGKATNIVPDRVLIRGELRGHRPDVLVRYLEGVDEILQDEKPKMPGVAYEFRYQEEFRAYCLDPEHPGVQRVMAAARRSGLEPQLVHTNGGSDNNVFIHRGLPGVVLSAGYIEPHSLKERVQLREMKQCAQFLTYILEEFACHGFA